MDPKYASFLSYHLSSGGEYVTLWNGVKEPISGYGTTLVRLGDKIIKKRNVFHVPGLISLDTLCINIGISPNVSTLATIKAPICGHLTLL